MSVTATARHTDLDPATVRRAVEARLTDFLRAKADEAADHRLPPLIHRTLGDFLTAGGKRVRPLLCVIGWHCGGHDTPPPDAVLQVAAALEMFHAFALIHDDVMDRSAIRRGRPTVHRTIATALRRQGRDPATADHMGNAAAILVGDLALTWSDELMHTAGLTPARLGDILPLVHAMRSEAVYGQYLDLTATGRPTTDVGQALRIADYKTARYTIERPLHIGAALAGADHRLQAVLTAYARPLGEAFQLRDDLLGALGTPAATGKPHTDDLRDGKHTALAALALTRADPEQRHILQTLLGDPGLTEDGAARIRALLVATGARDEAEALILTRHRQALHALDTAALPPEVTTALTSMADAAVRRSA
ncbi:polyprenyl synthetase family protein [Streptomyces sp. NPDC088350]|uniref:polyprenyl synthetase family protein n=1 Tax=Streptomyces sp. NPDC088350 TaxID=3365854 RepID=UPI003804755D